MRDYSFEALVDVTGAELSALTQDERGRINRALKQLRELQPDDYLLADQIHARAQLWHELYPEIALTPQALTGVWSSIEEKVGQLRKAQVKTVNAPMRLEACETCDGDKMVLVATRTSANERSGFEEYAPCPDCNSSADADFWRSNGTRFLVPDPGRVREMMNG